MTLHWLQTARGFRRTRSLPLTDRGYRYGMAVFETLRVDRGRVQFLAEHLASLQRACLSAGLPGGDLRPAGEFLQRAVRAQPSGVARLHVTAGDGAPGDPPGNCRVLLGFEPRAAVFPEACRLRVQEGAHHPSQGGLKTHNYWPQIAALQAAHAAGGDEALLFDPAGSLISAALANVFAVDESGALITPGVNLGARPGILRAWVCSRRRVAEASIDRASLRRAEEVFLTNSWFGVMPVASIDGRSLPGRKVAAELRAELQAHHDGTVFP